MFVHGLRSYLYPLLGAGILFSVATATDAEDASWTVAKVSGEVWTTTPGVQKASLGLESMLKPGDSIQTGANGRVLLKRGKETMLVAPNSSIGLPKENTGNLSTTILQQAGSILVDVEKRNENHFAVETPSLVAVVKGTQFRVSIGKTETSVDVLRGKVEVADFKTGQFAYVLPGQHAKVFQSGSSGLKLSGSGVLSPLQHGAPRAPRVQPISVPKGGFVAPRHAGLNPAAIKISAAIGEVKLDVNKATKGMARDPKGLTLGGHKRPKKTIWATHDFSPNGGSSGASAGGNGNGNGNGNSSSAANAPNGNGGGGGVGGAVGGAVGGVASVVTGNSGVVSIVGGVANGLLNGNGNAFGHLPCNPKSKGKSGC
jgi:hypothetical protein